MNDFISKHGIRIYSVLAALVPALVLIWPKIPWEALVLASAGLLGAGAVAASHEDTKTLRALYEDSPFESELRGDVGK
ncbi:MULTISPECIES: hypothetical protein [unclassified Streptomyces]|uniref:hypothetical protein n=1 Tax=unclassified Streptomyces TaxID=2593676 RepID=UPI0035E0B669